MTESHNARAVSRPPRNERSDDKPATLIIQTSALLFAVIINWLVSEIVPSGFFSLTSLALFCWMMFLMFKIDQPGAAIALPFIINRLSVAVSLIFISFGGEIAELGRSGEATSAPSSWVFFCAAMLIPYIIFSRQQSNRINTSKNGARINASIFERISPAIILCTYSFCLIATGYLLVRGLITGFPLITGTDRFLYRRFNADAIMIAILNLKFLVAIAMGVACFSLRATRQTRAIGFVIFVSFNLSLFLFGDKFFTMASNVAFFVMPYLVATRTKAYKIFLTYSPAIAAGVAILFSFTYYIYSDYGVRGPVETFDKIRDRVSGQGELWYIATYDNPSLAKYDGALVSKIGTSLVIDQPDRYSFAEGLESFYFAYKYAPTRLVDSMKRNNGTTTFTMSYEALGLVALGYAGLAALMALTGAFLALCALYVRYAILSKSPASAVLSSFVIVTMLYATNQGAPYLVLHPSRIKIWALIVGSELMIFLMALYFSKGVNIRQHAKPARD